MNMINELIKQGYKYLYIPKRCTTTFYATKCDTVTNDFDESAEFDEFSAVNDYEKAVLKVFDKSTFIKLSV